MDKLNTLKQTREDLLANAQALLEEAGRAYDPERHDPDSVLFDDSYVGPSERELGGGCNRCGGMDDCYCPSDEEIRAEEEARWEARTERLNR